MEKTNKNKHEDLAVELLEFRTFHVAVDNGGFSGQQVVINCWICFGSGNACV